MGNALFGARLVFAHSKSYGDPRVAGFYRPPKPRAYSRIPANYARRVYDPIANHFAVEIFGHIWDIAGDITDKDYKWEYWDTYCMKDQKETRRIIRDCVRKLPSQFTTCEFCINNEEDDWGNLFCKLTKESVRPDHSCEQGERET